VIRYKKAEPRSIPEGALVHASVVERMKARSDYKPVNLPNAYIVEP
jgi:hypothetical protein